MVRRNKRTPGFSTHSMVSLWRQVAYQTRNCRSEKDVQTQKCVESLSSSTPNNHGTNAYINKNAISKESIKISTWICLKCLEKNVFPNRWWLKNGGGFDGDESHSRKNKKSPTQQIQVKGVNFDHTSPSSNPVCLEDHPT